MMWFDRIKNFYDKGYYTKEDVRVFVPSFISEEEYRVITQQKNNFIDGK